MMEADVPGRRPLEKFREQELAFKRILVYIFKSIYNLNKKCVKYKNKIVPAFVQKRAPNCVKHIPQKTMIRTREYDSALQ